MFKNKLINIIIGIIIFAIILYLLGEYNPISTEFLINQHGLIQAYIVEKPTLSIILFIMIIALLISIMGPITPMCILAGFYFGGYIGMVIAVLGEVIGAMIVFIYSRYFFKEYFLKQFGSRFNKFKDGFNRNAINYLLFIRVIGGIPFGIQSLLPALFDMKIRDYFIATFFGVMPWAFILVSIGNGVQNIVDTQSFSSEDILKLEYLLPVLLISLIVIIPVIYKFIKKRF